MLERCCKQLSYLLNPGSFAKSTKMMTKYAAVDGIGLLEGFITNLAKKTGNLSEAYPALRNQTGLLSLQLSNPGDMVRFLHLQLANPGVFCITKQVANLREPNLLKIKTKIHEN